MEDKIKRCLLAFTFVMLMGVLGKCCSGAGSRCAAQTYKQQKNSVAYDTIQVVNKNIESIYLMDNKQYMIYRLNDCSEAVSVSKTIVDYILLCRELNCSCKLAILRRQKDGVLSRVIKYNNKLDKTTKEQNILAFKIYQK